MFIVSHNHGAWVVSATNTYKLIDELQTSPSIEFEGESLVFTRPPSAECSNQELNTFVWIGQALIGLAYALKMGG